MRACVRVFACMTYWYVIESTYCFQMKCIFKKVYVWRYTTLYILEKSEYFGSCSSGICKLEVSVFNRLASNIWSSCLIAACTCAVLHSSNACCEKITARKTWFFLSTDRMLINEVLLCCTFVCFQCYVQIITCNMLIISMLRLIWLLPVNTHLSNYPFHPFLFGKFSIYIHQEEKKPGVN